jgi:NAD(P)H-hydrate epimerase
VSRAVAVRVTDAAEAAAADRAAMDAGIPSRALMQRAGAAAAAEIARRWPGRLAGGVAVFAGTGNNGGDAWVVARALATAGVPVRVHAPAEPRTADAAAERRLALEVVGTDPLRGDERIVVDGVLGTGATGAPRGAPAEAIARMRVLRAGGARVAALDVPSGLDASTGAATGALIADLTLTFGSVKRGLLVNRAHAGRVVVLDIGLPADAAVSAPTLVTRTWVRCHVPPIAADAHKGTRRKIAIVGGALGMAGASVLAARAALASGAGMVRAIVAPDSLAAVQAAMPEALAARWPEREEELDALLNGWADSVLVGPGLGQSDAAHMLLDWVLRRWRGPLVLDADGLNLLARNLASWRPRLTGRPVLLTPHPAEFARLAGGDVASVLAARFDVGAKLAGQLDAAVLLKGTPTVLSAPDGTRMVSAAGTPALATAGSGDLLGGIAVTLLAQTGDALTAGACAAWAHGRAAERATPARRVRGVTLASVMAALPRVWHEPRTSRPRPPVLVALPRVGEPEHA